MQIKNLKTFSAFIFLSLYCLELFARAGGGSNGNGGKLAFFLFIIMSPFLIIYGFYINTQIDAKAKRTEKLLARLAKKDPIWNPEHLQQFVRTTFLNIQYAWSGQDLEKLRTLVHPGLFLEWKAQIEELKKRGQKNVMDKLSINEVRFVLVKNYKENQRDLFTVCIDAEATDYTINEGGAVVDSNRKFILNPAQITQKEHNNFREFWTFVRHNNNWFLFKVDQSESWKKAVKAALLDEDQTLSTYE